MFRFRLSSLSPPLSAAITGVYSSGLALLAMGIPVSRAATTTINAIIIGLGAFSLMFISDSFLATFQSFPLSIAAVMGSAGAIQLVDFYRQRCLGWQMSMANKAGYGGRNGRWTALLSLLIAANLGAVVSMLTGAGIYAFLTYVLKIELPGTSTEEVTQTEEKTI